MVHLTFSEYDKKLLSEERFKNSHPRVRQKMEAVWLKSQGISHKEICKLGNISSTTLTRYLKEYDNGGITALQETHFNKPTSKLEPYRDIIKDSLESKPVSTGKEAKARIYELTGISLCLSQTEIFLHRLGFSPHKVGMVPAKVNIDEQEEFKKKSLEPRIKEAEDGKRTLYFLDAAHFVLSPFLGILWSISRIFIKAPSGRQRFNVLGALNAITKELITVTNDKYINADSIIEMLEKIDVNRTEGIPITIVLDNAKYQKCNVVTIKANELDIELLYLPTYSPNLNLIERLWKFVKKECLYSKYYENFNLFKGAIMSCLEETLQERDKIGSLLNLKFQTFKKSTIMAT